MPDHVKNPGKYTCYSLDEPLYIGQRSDAGPPARTSSQSADANAPVLGSRAGDWGRDYLSEVEVAAETALSERPGAHAFRPRAGERGGGGMRRRDKERLGGGGGLLSFEASGSDEMDEGVYED